MRVKTVILASGFPKERFKNLMNVLMLIVAGVLPVGKATRPLTHLRHTIRENCEASIAICKTGAYQCTNQVSVKNGSL